ncbi:hypothetical protein [Bartonella sp. LJL80]
MSLYELVSMVKALELQNKGIKKVEVTDEELEQAEQMLFDATRFDPSVQLI